jgi:hypothetical protein
VTTEEDVAIMERLKAAVDSGQVTTEAEWRALCRNARATYGHVFSVLLIFGGRMPWDRGEASR